MLAERGPSQGENGAGLACQKVFVDCGSSGRQRVWAKFVLCSVDSCVRHQAAVEEVHTCARIGTGPQVVANHPTSLQLNGRRVHPDADAVIVEEANVTLVVGMSGCGNSNGNQNDGSG